MFQLHLLQFHLDGSLPAEPAFTKEFNERTKNDMGMIIPVIITVYSDRSFTFITKTPPEFAA